MGGGVTIFLLSYHFGLEAAYKIEGLIRKCYVIVEPIIKGDIVKTVKFKTIFMTMMIFHVKARAILNNLAFLKIQLIYHKPF